MPSASLCHYAALSFVVSGKGQIQSDAEIQGHGDAAKDNKSNALCVDRLLSCQPDTPVRIFGNS
jgi:hypothetical protein